MPSPTPAPALRIVHEGRGGYIEIDGKRYGIEHVEGGRFAIHFPSGNRHAKLAAHRDALERLIQAEPDKWAIDERKRRR